MTDTLPRLAAFTRRVAEHMYAAPVSVPTGTTCAQAVALMAREGASHAVVADASRRPVGILTEQDVTRRIAFALPGETPVEAVMSSPVQAIPRDEYLFHAIGRMRRAGLRHMPVVDRNGAAVGMLRLDLALAAATTRLVDEIDRLTRDDTTEGLRATKAAQAGIAAEMLEDAVPAPDVQDLLSRINEDLYHRATERCLETMAEDGRGEPPVPFEVVVMGSGGRRECFLTPDQDNGFVLADYPVAEHTRLDEWFFELATRVTRELDAIGLPFCNGNVMATNPLWRKPLGEWREQVSLWVGRSRGLVLRLADIFFDFAPVHGSGELSAALREHLTRTAPHPYFLREMFMVDREHGVALGLFGRLKTDPLVEEVKGKVVNLKLTGALPLIGSVRILALRERIPETATLARMQRLAARGVLDADEHDWLAGAYRHIAGLKMRQQVRDVQAGRIPGDHIPLGAMTDREREMLADGFHAVRRFTDRVRQELTAQVF